MRVAATITVAYVLALAWSLSLGLPTLDASTYSSDIDMDNDTIEEMHASFNDSPKNLYVVKAVVYEIGILTEVDDNDTSFESQERVDLTFFDAHTNESHIDLGNIPLPIQTNISGQVLTGIAPVNIGAFSSPSELLATLPLTGTIVNITHSDTAFYRLTTSNVSSAKKPQVLSTGDLSKLSDVASLFPAISPPDEEIDDVEPVEALNSLESEDA